MKMRKFSTGGIAGERVRVYDLIWEANGSGTCDLREGSPQGTILASLRLAAAGQVVWSSGDPGGVIFTGGLYATPTIGTLSVHYALEPMVISLPSGLYAWYDFADIKTLFSDTALTSPVTANSQAIGSVTDKTGNGHNLTRGGTSGSEPTYTVDTINALSVAVFDGSADYLKTIESSLTIAQPFTLFAVLTRTSTSTTDVYVGGTGTVFQGTSTASQQVQVNAGSALSTGTLATTAGIAASYVNGGSSKVYWTGGSGGSGAAGSNALTSAGRIHIGATTTPGDYHYGNLGEVLIYNRLLALTEINTVGTYLSRKWGLAWTTAT